MKSRLWAILKPLYASFCMALVAYNLISTLKEVLASVHASDSTPRKPKKKKPKPRYDPAHPHVSTARLLAEKKKSRASPD